MRRLGTLQVSWGDESADGVGEAAEAEGVVDVVGVVGVQQVHLRLKVGDEDLLDQELDQLLFGFVWAGLHLALVIQQSGQRPHRGVVVNGVERVQLGEEVDDEHLQEEEGF